MPGSNRNYSEQAKAKQTRTLERLESSYVYVIYLFPKIYAYKMHTQTSIYRWRGFDENNIQETRMG